MFYIRSEKGGLDTNAFKCVKMCHTANSPIITVLERYVCAGILLSRKCLYGKVTVWESSRNRISFQ